MNLLIAAGDQPLQRDEVLVEIVRRLVQAYQPEAIYLFGSKARGDDSPDSDYDLLVIVSDLANSVSVLLLRSSIWGLRSLSPYFSHGLHGFHRWTIKTV